MSSSHFVPLAPGRSFFLSSDQVESACRAIDGKRLVERDDQGGDVEERAWGVEEVMPGAQPEDDADG